jgi:hypothetical protein
VSVFSAKPGQSDRQIAENVHDVSLALDRSGHFRHCRCRRVHRPRSVVRSRTPPESRLIGASVKTVHTEASRLVQGGLITDSRRGNLRMLRAATDTPISRQLTDLLAVTYGPLPVLSDLLADVAGVSAAFIYGSWAARYAGEPGPVPNDVDVLIVGKTDRDDLDEMARAAEDRLGRPVSIRRISPDAWAAPDPHDTFVASVRQRPLVEIPDPSPRNGNPMRWNQGRDVIERLLADRHLQRVPASREQADRMIAQARQHLSSSAEICGQDPLGAYALLYDSARKALAAILENEGLRATTRGGHVAVYDAVRAPLGCGHRSRAARPRTDVPVLSRDSFEAGALCLDPDSRSDTTCLEVV